MPIFPSPKNPDALLRDFRNNISNRTNITNFESDTKIRSIMDTFTEEFLLLRDEYINAFRDNHIGRSRGGNLDLLLEGRGVTRRRASRAFVNSAHRNIGFYVTSGTFGDINGGGSIVIPRGTQISSNANTNELGLTVVFETTAAVTLAANTSIAYVSAQAKDFGTSHNVGAGVLRTHDYTGYSDFGNSTLKVMNLYPIVNARDEEEDRVLAYRGVNVYESLLGTNETKLRLDALNIPGVVDVRILPGYYGIGTVAVALMGAENYTDASMLTVGDAQINSLTIPGMHAVSIAAVRAEFDIDIEYETRRSLSESQKTRLVNETRVALRDYFRFVGIGGTADFSLAAARIQDTVTIPVNFNLSNNSNGVFKNVYFRKATGSSVDERYTVLTSTVALEDDEYAALGTLTMTPV